MFNANGEGADGTNGDDPYAHRVLAWSPSDASGITAATGLVTMASASVVEVSAREGWEAYEAGQAALAAQHPDTAKLAQERAALEREKAQLRDAAAQLERAASNLERVVPPPRR